MGGIREKILKFPTSPGMPLPFFLFHRGNLAGDRNTKDTSSQYLNRQSDN